MTIVKIARESKINLLEHETPNYLTHGRPGGPLAGEGILVMSVALFFLIKWPHTLKPI